MLREGFELVRQKKLEVTDDVSIIEALGRPVKVTQGSYTNIKVCTNVQTAFCPLQAGRAQQSLPCCDYAACLLLFCTYHYKVLHPSISVCTVWLQIWMWLYCMQVTTPDDMLVAEGFLMSKGVEETLESSLI